MISGVLKARDRSATAPLVLEDTEPEYLRVLTEIGRDMAEACPGFNEMMSSIRHFAAARLSSRRDLVLGVASARPGEGCTTVALGLAGALADVYSNVVYVEAGSGEDTLQTAMGYVPSCGLAGYVSHEATLDEAMLSTGKAGLTILPAGRQDQATSPLERLQGILSLFATLRPAFDVTVVDLPPLLASEDAPGLVSGLDGMVLVVSAGATKSSDVRKTLALCGSVPLEGIILNRAVRQAPGWLAAMLTSDGKRGLA